MTSEIIEDKAPLRNELNDLMTKCLSNGGQIQRFQFDPDRVSPFDRKNDENGGSVCPHCNETMRGPFMRRWHFGNCQYSQVKATPKAKAKKTKFMSFTCEDAVWNECEVIANGLDLTMPNYIRSLIEADIERRQTKH